MAEKAAEPSKGIKIVSSAVKAKESDKMPYFKEVDESTGRTTFVTDPDGMDNMLRNTWSKIYDGNVADNEDLVRKRLWWEGQKMMKQQ